MTVYQFEYINLRNTHTYWFRSKIPTLGILLFFLVFTHPTSLAQDQVLPDLVSTGTPGQQGVLRFFWGVGCPYCEQAKPLLEDLQQRYPRLVVEWFEVFETREHHEMFRNHLQFFQATSTGVPQFFFGENHWIGFSPQVSRHLEQTIARAMEDVDVTTSAPSSPINPNLPDQPAELLTLPFGHSLAIESLPLLAITLAIAFVDGFNPCSIWVLTLLLGLIVHTRSRKKILLVGTVFLLVTAGIYGLFMVGMVNIFLIAGISGPVRWIVALVAISMGLINAKDYVVFKRGFSLTIPERFRGPIAAGTRKIYGASNSPLGLIVTTALFAAAIAIVELPCTAGFPVIWSQYVTASVLTGSLTYWSLLLVYLLVYLIIELGIIIIALITLGRISFGENQARHLKLVGGALMISLGLHYLINPEVANSLSGVGQIFLVALVGVAGIGLGAKVLTPGPGSKKPR